MSKQKFASSKRRSAESAARHFGDSSLDNRVPVATPENVAFRYEVAGPFTRIMAFIVDMLLLFMTIFIVAIILNIFASGLGQFAEASTILAAAIISLISFFSTWLYGTLFETYWSGRTPGKWVCSLRVLTVDGRPINGSQAALRNFLRAADVFPALPLGMLLGISDADLIYMIPIPCFGVGLIVMSLNRRFQRLGDLAAGTIVIHERRKHHRTVDSFHDPRVAQLAEYIPASFQVSNELANTLSMYVQRREYFSLDRTREIASHLGVPLLKEFGLPADTSHDLLLCSLYYRTFLATEHRKEMEWLPPQPAQPRSPVAGPPVPNPPAVVGNQDFGATPPGYGPGHFDRGGRR